MFKPEQIRELLVAKDFVPFRIHMSDGSSFDVLNHDSALVGHNSVEVGVNPDANGIVDRFVRCALVHITRIEQLQPASQPNQPNMP